jgi:UDP-2,4-diacetamido-2,4,6-trideoxy-beta-L-altropyranose hydrolase
MNVVIRTDASEKIGTGHVMRCMTLADGLREKGAAVTFVCREHMGNLCDFIEQKKYKVYRLPVPAEQGEKLDWNNHAAWLGVPWEQDSNEMSDALDAFGDTLDLLVVDHYSLDFRWEKKLQSFFNKTMVIDDLADRTHVCDFLLDQNLYQKFENRYKGLVPETCHKLLGPQFALLRPEFLEKRKNIKVRKGKIKKIIVFMGGVDPTNETQKVLNSLKSIAIHAIPISVVLGSTTSYQEDIKLKFHEVDNIVFFSNVENMAEFMGEADLAIGGGGVTSWERCSLMLPAIILSLAENQVEIAKNLEKAGAALYLGKCAQVSSDAIGKAILKLLADPNALKKMSQCAGALVDGIGMTRVLNRLGFR